MPTTGTATAVPKVMKVGTLQIDGKGKETEAGKEEEGKVEEEEEEEEEMGGEIEIGIETELISAVIMRILTLIII